MATRPQSGSERMRTETSLCANTSSRSPRMRWKAIARRVCRPEWTTTSASRSVPKSWREYWRRSGVRDHERREVGLEAEEHALKIGQLGFKALKGAVASRAFDRGRRADRWCRGKDTDHAAQGMRRTGHQRRIAFGERATDFAKPFRGVASKALHQLGQKLDVVFEPGQRVHRVKSRLNHHRAARHMS